MSPDTPIEPSRCGGCAHQREPDELSRMRGHGFVNCVHLPKWHYVSIHTTCTFTQSKFTPNPAPPLEKAV